jgi:hypothetical protein
MRIKTDRAPWREQGTPFMNRRHGRSFAMRKGLNRPVRKLWRRGGAR